MKDNDEWKSVEDLFCHDGAPYGPEIPHPFHGRTFVPVRKWWVKLAVRLPECLRYPAIEVYDGSWQINWGWLRAVGANDDGPVGWIRLWGRGVQWKGPGTTIYFSERYGYRTPFLTFRGWRVFWLEKI